MPKTPPIPPTPPRSVEILAFPSVQLLDVAGPLQVFATANELAAAGAAPAPRVIPPAGAAPAPHLIVPAGAAPPYAPRVIARADAAVVSSSGLGLATLPLPAAAAPVHTLIVAGGPGVQAAAADAALVAWLAAHAAVAGRVVSVCTGAFLLASAGLLDGRRATTHWRWCETLARRFPAVRVESDPIFVRDGATWTSAGVTAGIDLALALVEQDLGRAAALAVARQLVVFLKRPGGQAQFSATLASQHADAGFEPLHAWMRAHLDRDLSVPALSAKAGMSERSFLRRYRGATGTTPARMVERLRVEGACRLLSDTRQPLKRIASRCGFGSEETMRRSFLRVLRTGPRDWRERFPG